MIRRLLLGVVVVGLALTAAVRPAGAVAAVPAGTPPGGTPCLPSLFCDPLGGLAGGAADAVGKAVFDGFVAWVADGATAVLGHVAGAMNPTTEVHLDADWFRHHVDLMRELAVAILLPLVLVGLIGAVIFRDFGRLVRATGVYVPVALIGGALAVQLTGLAVQVTDELTGKVMGNMQVSTDQAVEQLAGAAKSLTTPLTAGTGGLLTVVVLLLVIAGAIFVWIELLIRSAAIYVVVLFLPIGLSGLVWPATARWTRRMIEALAALILSKFVIVAVISLGAGMIAEASHRAGADKLDSLMTGATLLVLAAFAPFALLRLIPIAEAGVIGHLEGMERRPVAAAARAATTAAGLVMAAAGAAGGGAPGDPSAGAASAESAPSTPPTPGGQLNAVRAPEESGPDRDAAASGPAAPEHLPALAARAQPDSPADGG